MTDTKSCPQCHRRIPPDAPGGLCPECLFSGGMSPEVGSNPALAGTYRGEPSAFVPPDPSDLEGVFPQLEVLSLIGVGGMGAVYQARQTKLDRFVALKIIRPESALDPAFAERFNREARTLARMSHPHVVAVHDFGEVPLQLSRDMPNNGHRTAGSSGDGTSTLYYFVMEFVDGANLRQIMEGDGLSAAQAAAVVGQVCDALQYAHDQGVIHRDIKPENILLDQQGRVRIADFGLARLVSSPESDFTLTGTHQVMGTPRYMAPEQMAGSRGVDHRADIFSLGVVFYELLTGTLPLGSFEPPSAKIGTDLQLDQVVLKALATDPDRRFQQVSEFARQLYAVPLDQAASISVGGRDPQPWTGPSTILENMVGGAVRQVRDGVMGGGLRHSKVPGILAMVLSGVLMLLMLAVFLLSSLEAIHTGPTVRSNSLFVCGVAFALILILVGGGSSRMMRIWRPWIILFAGSLMLTGLFFVSHVAESTGPNGDAAGLQSLLTTRIGLATIAGGLIAVGMLLIGAWDLRNRSTRQDGLSGDRSNQSPRSPGSAIPVSSLRQPAAVSVSRGDSAAPMATSAASESQSPSGNISSARDSVTVAIQDLEQGQLPDVCMICGTPTSQRVTHQFSYQSELGGLWTTLGVFCGLFPGILIGILTTRKQRVACPMCPQHVDHWRRFVWFASTGWLLIILFGGIAGAIGWVLDDNSYAGAWTGVAIGGGLGIACYVIPMIALGTSRATASLITDDHMEFSRVSTTFVRAVRANLSPPPHGDGSGVSELQTNGSAQT